MEEEEPAHDLDGGESGSSDSDDKMKNMRVSVTVNFLKFVLELAPCIAIEYFFPTRFSSDTCIALSQHVQIFAFAYERCQPLNNSSPPTSP